MVPTSGAVRPPGVGVVDIGARLGPVLGVALVAAGLAMVKTGLLSPVLETATGRVGVETRPAGVDVGGVEATPHATTVDGLLVGL